MKKIYHTKQRKMLLAFLEEHKETPFTIEEIIEQMKSGEVPAPSSVYRLMKQLVEEGIVKRYAKEDSRQFFYQLVGGTACERHFHLKCNGCGKLFHLSEEGTKKIQDAVFMELGFNIEQEKNILFGRCEKCNKEEVLKEEE